MSSAIMYICRTSTSTDSEYLCLCDVTYPHAGNFKHMRSFEAICKYVCNLAKYYMSGSSASVGLSTKIKPKAN